MATPPNRRVYAPSPTTFPTHPQSSPAPQPSPEGPYTVVINVLNEQQKQKEKELSAGPSQDSPPPATAIPRTYGPNDPRVKVDLVSQINDLENPHLLCPDLIKRAGLKTQLAENSVREEMFLWIHSAHHDLQKALQLATEYTLGDAAKMQWLDQILAAEKTLKSLAQKHRFILPQPPRPIPPQTTLPLKVTTPPKNQGPAAIIQRVAAGIFALLALAFTVGMALNRYRIKNK